MNRHSRPLWVRLSVLLGLVPACFTLAACGRNPENAAADGKVLCDPQTGDAYFVRPGSGDTSFIKPHDVMRPLCKKA